MATVAVDRHQLDGIIAPAETAAAGGGAPVQKRRGWIKRMMYSPVAAAVGAEKGRTAAAAAAAAYDDDSGATRTTKPRRGGWLRRLMVPPPREHRRQRKLVGGGGGGSASSSRLLAGLPRWKRVSIGGGWASALLDAAAFRVISLRPPPSFTADENFQSWLRLALNVSFERSCLDWTEKDKGTTVHASAHCCWGRRPFLHKASTFNFVALYVYGIMGSGRLTWERDARLFDVKHWIKQG
ncbi:hypothetical protein SORBI_3003G248901 [Sorghum bicolor]|uniref:Uncharacterized protein n=1 Tax=Sorghum bicolor TaxID=4558 RepID=A0A1W0VYV5_SORBI|nr:hypothetical protein SORBI_3003G248901 [Sorghum bicolor]